MKEIAVNVAVVQDHKILLTQRDDFETWILPGGGVETGETIAVKWFSFDQIPSPLSLGHKSRIEDVIHGVRGACVRQKFNLPNYPEGMDRNGLYELRDNSGMSCQDFYLQLIEDATYDEKVEVGDV